MKRQMKKSPENKEPERSATKIYIDPCSDFGFKKIFGQEDGKDDLVRMLNTFFEGRFPCINSVTHLNTEKIGDTKHNRTSIYDVYIQDQKNQFYNIEMQNQGIKNPINREFSYICKAITSELKKGGDEHYDFEPTMGILIANFNITDSPKSAVINLIQYESTEPKMPKPAASILTVELPKFNKGIHELKSEKDVYLFLLKNMKSMQVIPAELDIEKYRPIFERAKIANLNKKEMTHYDRIQKQEEKARLAAEYMVEVASKKSRRIGKKEGIIQGKKEGIIEGKKEGIIEGKKEEAIHFIRELLKDGTISLEKIAAIASLPVQQIKKMKQQIGVTSFQL